MIKLPEDFLFTDVRGNLRATLMGCAEGVPFKPVQMLVVHNNAGVFRGFHYQTVEPMRKAVFCVRGMIRDFALNMEDGTLRQEVITPNTNGVLIEAHEAHGYHSPGESTVIYFYDKPFLRDKQAGFNPAPLLTHSGIATLVSEQDATWPMFKLEKSPSSQDPQPSNTEE